MTRPTKQPKTGIYRVRKTVPKALREAAGVTEWIVSLGTKDDGEARRKAPDALADIEARQAEARRRHDLKIEGEQQHLLVAQVQHGPIRSRSLQLLATPARPLPESGEREVRDAILHFFHGTEVAAEPSDRAARPSLDVMKDIATPHEDIAHLSDDRPDAVAEREYAIGLEAARLLRRHGYALPEVGPIRQLAIDLMTAAYLEGAHRSLRRLGDPSGLPAPHPVFRGVHVLAEAPSAPAPALAAPQAKKLPAAGLLKDWAAEQNPSTATLVKYTRAFAHAARILGFDDVRRIKAEDVVTFKQARLAANINPKTVKDEVLACGAVCKWAATNKMLASNPFAGLAPKVKRRGPKAYRGYTDREAALILTAARNETGWLRWGPWLLAFTGARVGEFAEMLRGHVRRESETWIFDFVPTEQHELKTVESQRLLPIHPALMQEGFLAYLETLPEDPNGPLFPDISPNARGNRIINGTSTMGRWVRRTAGIVDKRTAPSHSWRHRMTTLLRKVGDRREVRDAILGHENPLNAGDGYGEGFRDMPDETLKDLAKVPSPVTPLGSR